MTANATEDKLSSHYEDQAMIYKKELKLSEIVVVNFISEIPVAGRPEWWFITDDTAVIIVHVHYQRATGSIATIIETSNPEDGEKINLTSAVHDAAEDDVAQQLSDIRIDESSCISVGGFVFQLS